MAVHRTIFDEPHHQSLELLATQALAGGNIPTAFKLADRRCRILPVPEPHCYVLRSEALFRMGARANAIADLAKALEIAPDDIAANRRMLAWAQGQQQRQAALALIGHERNFDVLRKAIHILREDGERNFARITVTDATIEGWAVWHDEAPLEVSISNGTRAVREIREPDLGHPLSDCGRAIGFCIRRPKSATAQEIVLSISGKAFHSQRVAGNESVAKPRFHAAPSAGPDDHRVTVIVPIFCDYEATRLCLQSLLPEINSTGHHAILVNDATPDPQIAKYLAALEGEPNVEVLTNTHNLGFVGSVNRALTRASQGDIIILNSDTIVPPGFITRLAIAALSASDIGTVTPLSNNGEFTSFPVPNVANPIDSPAEVLRIDRIATKCNAGTVVDIPTGIGFCLYITRACLEKIGPFSEDFSPGYLEDADFCLRAYEGGFRSVCAPSVYVGHAGSTSFGREKRALVVRNLARLERQFPKHRMDCALFMAADPLRQAREAIERTAAAIARHPRLLVTGADAISAVARERARDVASDAKPAMVMEIRFEDGQAIVRITDAAGGMPQSLQFNLDITNDCESLVNFARCIEPSRVEFLDPANTPFQLVDLLLGLNVPYDMFIADAGLLGPQDERSSAFEGLSVEQFEIERNSEALLNAATGTEDSAARWQEIAKRAQRILVPCGQAEAFVASVLPGCVTEKVDCGLECRPAQIRRQRHAAASHLGFVPVRSSDSEQRLISETVRELGRIRPDISMTVIGATFQDVDLMRGSNTFVTGPVAPDEFEQMIATLGVQYLFINTTRALFAHPTLSAAFSSSVPIAYFDWSMGRCKPAKEDLPIDPRLSFEAIISALNGWIPKS